MGISPFFSFFSKAHELFIEIEKKKALMRVKRTKILAFTFLYNICMIRRSDGLLYILVSRMILYQTDK